MLFVASFRLSDVVQIAPSSTMSDDFILAGRSSKRSLINMVKSVGLKLSLAVLLTSIGVVMRYVLLFVLIFVCF